MQNIYSRGASWGGVSEVRSCVPPFEILDVRSVLTEIGAPGILYCICKDRHEKIELSLETDRISKYSLSVTTL